MKLPRRNFLHLAAGAAALPAVSRIARAQAYPSRPVRIIVPFAPAGSTDIVARLMGQWLSERLGQQFVTENRPGAGSNVGTEVVVNAPPDGYTLLLVGASSAINMTLYEKPQFQLSPRHHPRRRHHLDPLHYGGKPIGPGEDSSRVYCLCRDESEQGQHGFGRQRNGMPSVGRAVQDDGPRKHGPRSVSRRSTCTH
jgi:hypothetical protein